MKLMMMMMMNNSNDDDYDNNKIEKNQKFKAKNVVRSGF